MGRSRRGGALAGIALATAVLIIGCGPTSPRARALIKARKAAEATESFTYRLSLMTGVGIEWLRLDKREGQAILRDVLNAAERSDVSPDARADVVARSCIALAGADPPHAAAILLDGLRRLRRIDPQSDVRYWLLAALATRDLNQAVRAAKRLPSGERPLALAHIARAIAPTDLKRATELMTTAVAAPSPLAKDSDRWWADLAVAAAKRYPTEAVALAEKRIGESRLCARVLFAAVEALTPKDAAGAEKLIADTEVSNPVVAGWGRMAIVHGLPAEDRQGATDLVDLSIRDGIIAVTLLQLMQGQARTVGREQAVTMRPEAIPPDYRFMMIAQWSLFATLLGEQRGKRYLPPQWLMSRPRRDDELGMVMAAASYVDPPKALRIYEELLKRPFPKRVDAAPWIVLTGTAHLIVRIDPAAAKRLLPRGSADSGWLSVVPPELATIAGRLIQIGEPKRAAEMLAEAQRALEVQEADARKHPDDEVRQRDLWQSMESVAVGLAGIGKPDEAIKIADEIRDRGTAGETYLTIAQILGGARPKQMDRFEAVRRVATWLDGMSHPSDPVLPWTPAAPADRPRSRPRTHP